MKQYDTLINILDDIRLNSSSSQNLYHPEMGKVTETQARARALISFFLKSYFGILDFNEREKLITDGHYDGGLDAFYIDNKAKRIYLIQSKFRENAQNYATTEINNEELWSMDLERIYKGFIKDKSGNKYNKKVLDFQKEIKKLKNKAEYEDVIILIANLRDIQQKYIVDNFFPKKFLKEIFNYQRFNREILFPYITGSFFNEEKLHLNIAIPNNSFNIEEQQKYKVKTKNGICYMKVFFVPTLEIGREMNKYKNSILKYNPRSYLGLSKEGVNQKIEDSIMKLSTNDFVLLNNGITILCSEFFDTTASGNLSSGCLTIVNPQIINGGQTSFALSHIYEKFTTGKIAKNPFKGKTVLLKVIENKSDNDFTDFAGDISLATNNQSQIELADLKSNHKSQASLQGYIFEEFGLFYERKKGEFYESIKNSYIKKESVIKRAHFLKSAYSSYFPDVSMLKRNPKNIKEKDFFSDSIFPCFANKNLYKRFILSYFVFVELQKSKKNSKKSQKDQWFFQTYGNALRFGDLAVCMVATYRLDKTVWKMKDVETKVREVLLEWKDFEEEAFSKKANMKYFNPKTKDYNFAAYYKSSNLITDLVAYFK